MAASDRCQIADIISFRVPSGLTNSPSVVTIIADDFDILCLLIWQEISHFSSSSPKTMRQIVVALLWLENQDFFVVIVVQLLSHV